MVFWDSATGEGKFRLESPWDQGILGFSFSPNGRRLATAHDDGTVKIWDFAELVKRK